VRKLLDVLMVFYLFLVTKDFLLDQRYLSLPRSCKTVSLMAEGEGYQSKVKSFLHICDDCILPLMLWAVEKGVIKLRH
jgi:hypothetical protein